MPKAFAWILAAVAVLVVALFGLAIGVALVGSVVCLGYLYGVRAIYGPSPYTVIATHTAVLLLALALGVLFGHPSAGLMLAIASDTGGGTMARRLLPVAILAPITVGGLWLWGARGGFYRLEIGVSTVVVSMIVILSIVIWWNAGDLLRTESERRRAEQELKIRELHQTSLLRLSKKLELASTHAEVMDAALEEVSSVMGYRSVWAYLLSDDGETASIIQASGDVAATAERDIPVLRIRGDRFLEELRDATGVVVVEDARTDPRTNKEIVAQIGNRTIVNAPMMLADRRIGLVGTGSMGDEGVKLPDSGQLDFFAAMVGHVAVAIDRIRLLSDRARAVEETRALNAELNARVIERTTQLEAANKELEAFSYSVSHDLRAPLRHIDGFSKILLDEHAGSLEPRAQRYLTLIRGGALTMGRMIDDLLQMARVDRRDISFRETDLNEIVAEVMDELRADVGERIIEWQIERLPVVVCDPGLVKLVFANLLSNAVKYTRNKERAHIRVGQEPGREPPVIVVQDNGAGFDPRYADKLFGVFRRLHRTEEFEGTGIGLATVQRIVQKHGGRVWADAKVEEGATFSFTLSPGPTAADAVGDTLGR
jgi:signal transduction histidine kinase